MRDGKNSDPGSGINITDPQHCSERRKSKREVRNLNISGSVGEEAGPIYYDRVISVALFQSSFYVAGNTIGFEQH
jgi:hypothetical protein